MESKPRWSRILLASAGWAMKAIGVLKAAAQQAG
jgi:hypothetical protein